MSEIRQINDLSDSDAEDGTQAGTFQITQSGKVTRHGEMIGCTASIQFGVQKRLATSAPATAPKRRRGCPPKDENCSANKAKGKTIDGKAKGKTRTKWHVIPKAKDNGKPIDPLTIPWDEWRTADRKAKGKAIEGNKSAQNGKNDNEKGKKKGKTIDPDAWQVRIPSIQDCAGKNGANYKLVPYRTRNAVSIQAMDVMLIEGYSNQVLTLSDKDVPFQKIVDDCKVLACQLNEGKSLHDVLHLAAQMKEVYTKTTRQSAGIITKIRKFKSKKHK